ncbi:mutator-like element [Purpureocillium lavendulum]|uniref:Mutator-like element n=1 Tax=Purpureocillium lavendulum TaxID=1247861 RepID=A0AB34FDC9_9HYPO|nr:mutator-like element [Purpureocillium lavendulum]
MAFTWRFIIGGAGKWGATVAVAVVLLAAALRPLIVKVRRRKNSPRSGTLKILSDPDGAKFEFVDPAPSSHGLIDPFVGSLPSMASAPIQSTRGLTPPQARLSVEPKSPERPQARVLSFEHDSNWLTDAPVKTSEEIGNSLLREIKDKRSVPHLPIIFIGHSLGGIIVKQALCAQDSEEVVDDTSGIIFLGTPHLGSSASVAGAILGFATGLLGSDMTLVLSLKSHDAHLSNLAARFRSCLAPNERRGQKTRIISFYETKPMYLFGWLTIGRVVPRYSAVLDADPNEEHGIDTDHSGLNKCAGRDDKLYQILKDAIGRLRAPSRLEQADKLIRDEHYKEDKLQIDRLSGVRLPMDQCYINLAVVEQADQDAGHSNEEGTALSQHTLLSRQKIEVPDKTMVDLATIFSHRKGRNGGMIEPKRILIRGRAGMGKTTLCKKIVHEFTRGTWNEWSRLFDRVLWVPLRRLKGRDGPYNLGKLFHDEYFSHLKDKDGERLADAMSDATPQNGGRTLFILDGLDEVSGEWNRDDDMSRFLKLLLGQQNVIITSRPNASLPADIPSLDLELETIGFYPDQVKAYLDADSKIKPKADAVQSFLQKHWLIQGLVRIPIQLDALCYTWEDLDPKAVPNTMTGIYTAIVQKLWKKDAVRLGKMSEAQAQTARPAEIERCVNTEIALLECLSFNGLYDNVIGFTPAHRDKIVERFKLDLPLDETLARLSFMRTTDPSSKLDGRTYHFLHLTFQEYFAARYFVQQWRDGEHRKPLDFIFKRRKGDEANLPTDPAEFLRRYKYSAHYDVFWRFVAGLLEVEGEKEILGFFHTIEKEPFDLLGPTHQRLVMHCLSEVAELPIRSSLEERLSQWLLFECGLTGSSLLATESELPDRALQNALKRASGRGRVTILEALGHRGRHLSETTVAALAALLKDEDFVVRYSAANALGGQSNLPEGTLAALAALLKHEDGDVRASAAEALGRQSNLPEGTLAALAALLKDEDGLVRYNTAEALAGQSNLPQATLAALLKDERGHVRSSAAKALAGQPNLPQATLAALAALLKHEHWHVRSSAAQALGRQSNLPEGTLAALAALLQDEHGLVRVSAAQALGRQSNLPEGTLAALAALLQDEHQQVRSRAAEALGRQSNLLDAVLKAIGLLLEPERQGETTGCTIRNPEFLESLYESLLWRSFREQSSLYIDDDSCVINQSTGLRTGSFEHPRSNQFRDAVRQHRQHWSVPYMLWDSCKGEDHEARSPT